MWRQDLIPDSTSDGNIADQAQAVELLTSDWGGAVAGQPVLHGLPLIGVPISSNDWVLHPHLQCNTERCIQVQWAKQFQQQPGLSVKGSNC